MIPSDYERRKHTLDEQLRLGIELLQSVYQIQLRALEMMRWSNSAAPLPLPKAADPASSPPSTGKRRRFAWSGRGELCERVREALGQLPEEVTKNDILGALGFSPERSSLHRVIEELVSEGALELKSPGKGRLPSIYRQRPAPSEG
jgi:hypothetical protein